MDIPFYQIDAFTGTVFAGNPAGVCLLQDWLDDTVLQNIAAENNLPETAFIIPQDNEYAIRWFTPEIEIDLCGHATLASGHVIFKYVDTGREKVRFESKSGPLGVSLREDLLVMDFPSRMPEVCPAPQALIDGLDIKPIEVHLSRDYLALLENEEQVRSLSPDMGRLNTLDCLGIIVTAPGDKVDFVSRFFAPRAGIAEDPVTGSAHSTLIPFWAKRSGKTKLHALQLSKRGGELFCEHLGERVAIGGQATTYLSGTIMV